MNAQNDIGQEERYKLITKTLYEELGGRHVIEKVVDSFYDRVLSDPTVNHFFKNVDMEKQRAHQTKFISFALGGPNQYSGKSMAKVHQGMNLQPIHYNAIIKHLSDTLAAYGVEQNKISQVISHIDTLRDDILYK